MIEHEVVALTRKLLAIDTINPPGSERACAELVAAVLEPAGFSVEMHEFATARTSMVATLAGSGARPALCFTGHFDTVPLGAAAWARDPFAGEIEAGRLWGRGSSDMKAGLAAMVIAALTVARASDRSAGLSLVFTAGEETYCDGARQLAELGILPPAGALLVGEPTGNQPFIAHKGCVRYLVHTSGVTAHASLPEQGDNAIYKAAEAVLKLRGFEFGVAPHPVLGRPTLNVGMIRGGMNINSVPDAAVFSVDIRTVAGQEPDDIYRSLQRTLGKEAEVEKLESGAGIASDPEDPWVNQVFEVVETIRGRKSAIAAAPYFTDASFLKPALGSPPTVILGPGEVDQAHKTDEWCEIAKIEQALELYGEIARRWCCG